MKVLKILGWLLVVLIAFVALSVYLTASNLNSIVKQVVEQVGTETLQTQVTLREADIQLLEGKARLSGLVIENLPTYQAPNLFEMETVAVALNLEAMADKVVDITEVRIEGIKVTAEQKGTRTNIQALMDNLPKSSSTTGNSKTPGDGESQGESDLRFKIGEFVFAENSAELITENWGAQQVRIPTIRLQAVGGAEGVPPEQLANAILQPLIRQVNAAMQKGLKQVVEDKAKQKLDEKEAEAKEKARQKLQEKLGENAGDAESALKSLFSK